MSNINYQKMHPSFNYADVYHSLKLLEEEYPNLEVTDINAREKRQKNVAYLYDKRQSDKHGNRIMEVWGKSTQNAVHYIIQNNLCSPSEIKESQENHYKETNATRSKLVRFQKDCDPIEFIRNKLDKYFFENNNSIIRNRGIESVNPATPPTPQPAFIKKPEKYADDADYIEEVNEEIIEVDETIEYNPEPKPVPEKVKTSSGERYPRDPKIGAKAIKRANFKCEINPKHESFIKVSDGNNYMEAHHIIPVSQQECFKNSLDVEANVVSLCCTCHRAIHFGVNKPGLLKLLLDKREKELKKAGINISFEELFEMYK